MKAKLKAKIVAVNRINGSTELTIESNGKAETTNINAQEASLDGHLILKSLVADKMKLGAIITINISDEEEDS